MAFEGLLSKLGPSLVRELSPHVLTLVSGFLDRFRKDTNAMKTAFEAEIASLGRSQEALAALATKQTEAVDLLQKQFLGIERKIDRLQESQDATARQLASLEEQIKAGQGSTRWLPFVMLLLLLLTLAAVLTLLFVRR